MDPFDPSEVGGAHGVPTLLQVDSSARLVGSVSRHLTGLFAAAWQQHHVGGNVEALDVARQPLTHFPAAAGAQLPAQERDGGPASPAKLCAQVRRASCVVIGAPMYTFTVPGALKAWLDRISQLPNLQRPGMPPPLGPKRIVIVQTRGGSYAPNTPRSPFNFQTPLLQAIFAALGLADDLHLVAVEMTQATDDAKLAAFRPLQAASLAAATEQLLRLAAQDGKEPP